MRNEEWGELGNLVGKTMICSFHEARKKKSMTKKKHVYQKELMISEKEMHSSKTWGELETIVT